MSVSSPAPAKKPLLSDTLYNLLKKTVTMGLPAVATLYVALSGVWGLPQTDKVVGTITAVTTVLGALLHLSTATLSASNTIAPVVGDLVVEQHPTDSTKSVLVAHLDQPATTVAAMTKVAFNVSDTGGTPVVPDSQNPPNLH